VNLSWITQHLNFIILHEENHNRHFEL
jgi:hypothetical protein